MTKSRAGRRRVPVPTIIIAIVAMTIAVPEEGQGRRIPPAARLQSASATLSGTVADERGAVIPGAAVTVSNAETGLRRQITTDGEGSFTFPFLPPNSYKISVVQDGFDPLEIRNVVLNVYDHRTYRIQLRVGGVGAHVVVEDADATGAGTAHGGMVVGRRLVENLPLNGRSVQTLFELAPGAVLTRATFGEQGQFSVNGQRANANYFTVDGVSANFGVSAGPAPGQSAAGALPALTALGGTNNLVSVEGLQEFRLQTSTYAPEFGRTPGAQVSAVTRAGTNELRGTVFNYFRHAALDANDWFANSRGLRKPGLRQNNFGGVLGGRMVRDRLFFFLSYEGLRLRQPRVTITEVPSLGARRAAPPPVRPILDAFPLPNGADAGNGYAEFAASYSDPSSFDAASLRLDATVGEKLSLFGRFNVAPSEVMQRGQGFVLGSSGQSLNTLSRAAFETTTLTLGATATLSPRAANDLRFNWSRAEGRTAFTLDGFGGARPPAPPSLFPPPLAGADARYLLILEGGVSSSFALGKNADNLQRQLNLVDNFWFASGSHLLKFGVDYRRLSPVYGPPLYSQAVTFGEARSDVTGAAVASSTGRATLVNVSSDGAARHPLFTNLSAFVQDTWRAASRLTVTYGVRWELNPPPSEAKGNHPLAADGRQPIVGEGPDRALNLGPAGTRLWRTTYGNFAPRVGVAYQPSEKLGWVFRGGFGLFYDLGGGQAAQAFGSVAPYAATVRLRNVALPLDPAQAAPPQTSINSTANTVYAFDPGLKLPYTLQWSAGFEQPLGTKQLFSAAYVAAAGRRLLREAVQQPLNFPEVRVVTNTADSSYHAMQLQFERRASESLQAVASYTWAHSIDTASEDSARGATIRRLDLRPDRGPSSFDVRHSFTAALTYDFPARKALRHWSLDAIFRARSATPVNVFYGGTLLNGEAVGAALPPGLDAGVPLYLPDPSAAGGRRINRAAFDDSGGQPLGRNALRGFGFSQIDLAARRRFPLTENVSLLLRVEVFNLFNRPNFADPVGDLNSSLFGQSLQTLAGSLGTGGVNGGLSPIYQVGGPRSIQLALKLHF